MQIRGSNNSIFKGISFAVLFNAAVFLVITALFLLSTKGEFIKAFSGELGLSPSFYVYTLLVILMSSVLYTPFSFGISYYFINSKSGNGRFSQIFYLFKTPALLFKAILMNSVKQILLSVWRVIILASAVILECGLFVITVILDGQNIFDYEDDFFATVSKFISQNNFFILLTVLAWCLVIIALAQVKMRYIFCKYALIRYPDLGIIECIRVGAFSIRGRILKTVAFYYKYIVMYIFTFLTFGLAEKKRYCDSFSFYAMREVERGIERYYRFRNH